MFSINDLNEQLKDSLTSITGVSDWFTIEFSMLPSEDPKGFIYPIVFQQTRTTLEVSWFMGIKVADTDISLLNATCFQLIEALVNSTANPANCLTDKGNFEISKIDLEIPSSFTNENIRSNVTAYVTVLSCEIKLQTGITQS